MANDMSRAPRYPFARGNPRAEPDARGYDPRQYAQNDPRQYQQPQYQQPEPPPSSITDPLSELARLIGETKPFDEPRQSQRDPHAGWPGHPQQPAYSTGLPPLMPEYRNDPPPPLPPQDRYAPPQPRYGAPYVDPRDHGHHEPAEYGHPPQGPYYGDDGRLMPQDPYAGDHYGYAEPRRRGGLMMMGVVAGLVLLGLGGAYAYRTMLTGGLSGPPPLIKADTAPSKIVPAQSGADGAAGKQIYDRVAGVGTQDEKIVSREEQPVDVRNNVRPGYPNAGTLPPQTPSSNSLMQPPGASQANPVGSQNQPRPVKTIPIRPDVQGNTSPAQSQRSAAAQPQGASAPAQGTARTAAGNAPLSLTPGAPAAAERAPAANSAATSVASANPPAGIGYMVQVSAQKTQAEATSAFKAAQARYSNLLGNYQVVLRKKENRANGTMYGAQVGPFETKSDADGLCTQLKSAGGNCFVEKN